MIKNNAFRGKIIVVTGDRTGLAKAMSKYFSEVGVNVIISSRKITVLKTAAKISTETGNEVFTVQYGVVFPYLSSC